MAATERQPSTREELKSLLLALHPAAQHSPHRLQHRVQQTNEQRRSSVARMEKEMLKEVPFEIRTVAGIFSLGDVVAYSGGAALLYSLATYFANQGESNVLQIITFVYGIPATVGGLALKYSEIAPVEFKSSPAVEAVRNSKANENMLKIVNECTRWKYGEDHLYEALIALKLGTDLGTPTMKLLTESVTESGEYKLTMVFESINIPFKSWKERGARLGRFFGPNCRSELRVADNAKRLVEMSLITVAEGEDSRPREILDDGSSVPIEEEGNA